MSKRIRPTVPRRLCRNGLILLAILAFFLLAYGAPCLTARQAFRRGEKLALLDPAEIVATFRAGWGNQEQYFFGLTGGALTVGRADRQSPFWWPMGARAFALTGSFAVVPVSEVYLPSQRESRFLAAVYTPLPAARMTMRLVEDGSEDYDHTVEGREAAAGLFLFSFPESSRLWVQDFTAPWRSGVCYEVRAYDPDGRLLGQEDGPRWGFPAAKRLLCPAKDGILLR